MTMEILIKHGDSIHNTGYLVHREHESDMYDFLKNHSNKQNMSIYTRNHEGVGWFRIKLTPSDVKFIKETTWYRNTSWDFPEVEKELKIGTYIEVFYVEPIAPKE